MRSYTYRVAKTVNGYFCFLTRQYDRMTEPLFKAGISSKQIF